MNLFIINLHIYRYEFCVSKFNYFGCFHKSIFILNKRFHSPALYKIKFCALKLRKKQFTGKSVSFSTEWVNIFSPRIQRFPLRN